MITEPALSRAAIDRAAHRRQDPQWLAAAWQRSQVVIVDTGAGGASLVTSRDELVLFPPDQVDAGAERFFLGVDADGNPYFGVDAVLPKHGADGAELAGARSATLREVADRLPARDADLMATAAALAFWHARHRFSASVGEPTEPAEGGWARRGGVGGQEWPRTDPAVIVLVHDGAAGPLGRCLLAVGTSWHEAPVQRFSCLAGFVEPGESAESAVAREVAEEVGAAVDEIAYVASQPWPFPASLMLGFTARADPGVLLTLEPAEIARARWFTRAEVAGLRAGGALLTDDGLPIAVTDNASISTWLIDAWLASG
ncbi:NAD(+) diphosphatase [Pilimelia columellifera]|uniref:NAD(+) diphosphatase n=1 Tax=Pilimelia columellifera subsp. columellifera TaxID=706583 RepID=A0ABP6AHE6_9ACTN